ncbi:MAG: YraN family protein [Gemmatimonadota bacterium]|jgi:putative endonuclease
MRAHRRGRVGESAAAAYLERRGWAVLERNWRFHHKEIDLIVERDGTVAFVEVKARRSDGWGHPLDAITAAKRRDLITAARGWIMANGRDYHTFRFDAVVVVSGPESTTLEHVEDAWRVR